MQVPEATRREELNAYCYMGLFAVQWTPYTGFICCAVNSVYRVYLLCSEHRIQGLFAVQWTPYTGFICCAVNTVYSLFAVQWTLYIEFICCAVNTVYGTLNCTEITAFWDVMPCSRIHTECNRRNVWDFGRVFLRSNYTDITQNTYIQSSMVTEILAREKCGLLWCLRTVLCPWLHTRRYLLDQKGMDPAALLCYR